MKTVTAEQARAELARIIWEPALSQAQLNGALAALNKEGHPDPHVEEKFMDVKAARAFAGNVSRTTFYRWTQAGLKGYRVNRRILFLAKDIRKFITEGKL